MPRAPDPRQLRLQFGDSRIPESAPAEAPHVVPLPTTASRRDRLRREQVRAVKELGRWWRCRR